MIYDTIIIGCGPAGMTAALYLTRDKKKVCVIEGSTYGGQMASSPLIENYPGFKGSGLELADQMFNAIEKNINFVMATATKITYNKHFFVETDDGTYEAETIIWAAGAKHRKLNVPGEDLSWIHYCVTCDGPLYTDKKITIIGDANSALQYTLQSMSYTLEPIHLLTLTNKLFGEKILKDKVIAACDNRKIDWIPNLSVRRFEEKDDKHYVVAYCDLTQKEYMIETDGAFVAIGFLPQNKLLIDLGAVETNGYIVTDNDCCAIPGVYAIGDCRYKKFKQVAGAVGDGMTAAMACSQYLKEKTH